jgi:hypothetical protein
MSVLHIYQDCFYYESSTISDSILTLRIGFDKNISQIDSLPSEDDRISSHDNIYGIIGMFTTHLLVITDEVAVGELLGSSIFRCDKILALPFDVLLAAQILDADLANRPSERDPCKIPLPASPKMVSAERKSHLIFNHVISESCFSRTTSFIFRKFCWLPRNVY